MLFKLYELIIGIPPNGMSDIIFLFMIMIPFGIICISTSIGGLIFMFNEIKKFKKNGGWIATILRR